MQEKEFDKIWNLLKGLWPANIGKVNRRVWQIGLAPYRMDECSGAIMNYARRNKHFPDLADVTAGLLSEEEPEQDEDEMNAKFTRDVIAKYGSWAAYREKIAGWIRELEAK